MADSTTSLVNTKIAVTLANTDVTGPMLEQVRSSRLGPLKRARVQLNCTYCRVRKLKCDRQSPCHQCLKRGRAPHCNYPVSTPRKKPPVSMQNKLQHLESLVKDAMTYQTPSSSHDDSINENRDVESLPGFTTSHHLWSDSIKSHKPGEITLRESQVTSGSALQGTKNTTYIGATHWAAILDDIEEVKTYFDDEEEEDRSVEDDVGSDTSLIFQLQSPTTINSLIAALPQRSVVDKLISRYFKAPIPSRHLIHKPSFQRQYKEFWENPVRSSPGWVALIYAMISHGIFAALGSGEESPDWRGTHLEMINAYRKWCSQCLVLSNYAQPGPTSIEALLIYIEGGFMLSEHDQINCYVLVGVAVRLSMRVGLHRDPTKVAGNISVFQAELRRRLWHFLVQVDLFSSCHIGLPGMVQAIESDTEHPRNLRDEDFHENSVELPAGRPESEMTPMSYILCKGRICGVFSQIAAQANRLSIPAYDDVLQLDDALSQAFAKVPALFRVVPLELAITDSVELIIQRFSIAVLYYKSRCVLHRKYLMSERDDHKYSYSKKVALDASIQLLHYQSSIHDAVQPNNLLSGETWFITSLSIHDFLLAATIVYLTLMETIRDARDSSPADVVQQNRALTVLLERSHTVWSESLEVMSEAKKASEIVELMLRKVKLAVGSNHISPTEAVNGAGTISHLSLDDRNSLPGMSNRYFDSFEAYGTPISQTAMPSSLGLPFDSSISLQGDPIGTMLDMPMNFDWDSFDNHLRPQIFTEQSWIDLSMSNFDL